MNDTQLGRSGIEALRTERGKRKQAERDLQASHQHIARLSVENAQLRDRLTAATASVARRDQTIAGLRQALNNRKGQTNV